MVTHHASRPTDKRGADEFGGIDDARLVARSTYGQTSLTSPDRRLRAGPSTERGDALVLERDAHLTPVVLGEYSAIRQEIQTALSNQQSALSIGAATLGLLAAVGAHFWPDD